MYESFIAIVDDGNKMLNDDFMMPILKLISDAVPEFGVHIDYILEWKQTPTIMKNK